MRYFGFRRIAVILFILVLPLVILSPAVADEKAPDFTLTSVDGTSYSLSKLRGKVVVLNFWATWCAPCLEEMPTLDSLYKRYRQRGLVVLGVSIDRKRETVEGFLEKNPVSYPILLDTKGEVFVDKYTVSGLPATYIIDGKGLIVDQYIGKRDFTSEDFLQFIEGLLKGGYVR